MNPVFRSISTRIIIPILAIVSLLAIVLYLFVLRTVSDFAENSVTAKLIELRKDVYDICDLKYDSILLSEKGDDEKFVRIQKSHAISSIEDFARNNLVDLAIRQADRYIYYTSQFPSELKEKEEAWSRDTTTGIVFGDYFVSKVTFEPWGWNIFLFKNKEDFGHLYEKVNWIYGVTGIILAFLAAALFFYLDKTVAGPLKMLAQPLKEGHYPKYHGIEEFEFLSNSIKEMMQRLQQEAEVRISEEKLRSIIESLMIGIAVTNPEGTILEANTTQARMLGYESREDIVGRSALDFYYDPAERPNVVNLAKMNMLRDYEFRLKRNDGSFFWASLNMLPIETTFGLQFICSVVDISPKRMAESELINSHLQLRRLSRHLTLVREEERKTIAREIHDELGQELTALNMYIATLVKNLPEGRSDLKEKTADMTKLVDRTIKVVQRLVNELRPGVLDALGLKAAIESDIARFEENSDIVVTAKLTGGDMLGSERAVAMYRVWQEALTNVMRHSGATEVKVELEQSGENVIMEISDNGKGIDETLIDHPQSFGIIGMKERIQMVEGSFRISSNGGGTIVHVEVPCE